MNALIDVEVIGVSCYIVKLVWYVDSVISRLSCITIIFLDIVCALVVGNWAVGI